MELKRVAEKEPRATVNPYHQSAALTLRRLKWDVSYKSWASRRHLKSIENSCAGQKVIVVCNGPSLARVDFELLEHSGIYTFGLNKINLLFDQTSFRPSCIVAMNLFVLEQNRDFYNQTDIPLYLNADARHLIPFRRNVCFLHDSYISRKFARDCSMSITQGHTVTYAALQLTFHMGFQQVALIGCDHDFVAKGPANAPVIAGESDPDHFHPDYFANGVTWQLPDLRSIEVHFELARDTYERYGRKIYNSTEGGKLEIFERQDLSEFLAS